MNTIEKCLIAGFLVGVGVAAGMWYEHRRFLAEMQGHVEKHRDKTPAAPEPDPLAGGA